jgi:rRNA processing protein Gar1
VVLAITPSGLVTARAAPGEPPREGTELRAERGGFRGIVVRVFGPVAHPYLALRPRRALGGVEAAGLIGTTLVQGGNA